MAEAKSDHVNETVPTAAGGAGDTGTANRAATNDPAAIARKPIATSGHRDLGTRNRPSRATSRLPTRTTILRSSKRRPTLVQTSLRSMKSIAALSKRPKPALNRRRSGRLVVADVVVGAGVVDRAAARNRRVLPKPVMPPTLNSAMKVPAMTSEMSPVWVSHRSENLRATRRTDAKGAGREGGGDVAGVAVGRAAPKRRLAN